MLQARSWAGISRHKYISWALPSCPPQLALLVEISYHKDKWLFNSLLREWGEGEKGLDARGVLCAPTQFDVTPCERGASNFGDPLVPQLFWGGQASGLVDAGLLSCQGWRGGAGLLHTAVPGTCSGPSFLITAFLTALCLSQATQVRLMAGLLWSVGHEPNFLVTVKLQCLLCKIVVTFRSDWKVNFSSLLKSLCLYLDFFSQI